eukprot:COSAG06_NODE_30694_length_534_cov_0.685057_1_plen_40_part_10
MHNDDNIYKWILNDCILTINDNDIIDNMTIVSPIVLICLV